MKKIAVILSGCGHLDGSEITEAVSVIIALSQCQVSVDYFAPSLSFAAKDHLTSETKEQRNALVESCRITRGQTQDLNLLQVKNYDGLVLPGGQGASRLLSTWSTEGARCTVLPEVEKVIKEFYAQQKPIAAVCIAPAVVARVLGKQGISVTLGNDPTCAQEIEKTGAQHENCPADEYISDRHHRILSTPAYMCEATPAQTFNGISKMIRELVEMA